MNSLDFSPSKNLIVSASRDKTVKLWDANGNVVSTLSNHRSIVTMVSFSYDGTFLASMSPLEKMIMLWCYQENNNNLNKEKFSISYQPVVATWLNNFDRFNESQNEDLDNDILLKSYTNGHQSTGTNTSSSGCKIM